MVLCSAEKAIASVIVEKMSFPWHFQFFQLSKLYLLFNPKIRQGIRFLIPLENALEISLESIGFLRSASFFDKKN